jgi:hypothetical protein
LNHHLAAGAVKRHLHALHPQVLRGDIGLNGARSLVVQVLQGAGLLAAAPLRLHLFAAKQLFTGFFDETEKTQIPPSAANIGKATVDRMCDKWV